MLVFHFNQNKSPMMFGNIQKDFMYTLLSIHICVCLCVCIIYFLLDASYRADLCVGICLSYCLTLQFPSCSRIFVRTQSAFHNDCCFFLVI